MGGSGWVKMSIKMFVFCCFLHATERKEVDYFPWKVWSALLPIFLWYPNNIKNAVSSFVKNHFPDRKFHFHTFINFRENQRTGGSSVCKKRKQTYSFLDEFNVIFTKHEQFPQCMINTIWKVKMTKWRCLSELQSVATKNMP